ncbi:hypothetical protein SAMN05421678_12836 [Actinopolymorpha cephalotaxi]|uniref:CHASE2 domain-containing sensor protein n=1 Tax=Actinopolymorpha cephalotaxi TaxID=504797 RepID=A0A1I3C3D2_9ACTN|nr:hypothetical protein [Actinopolymorpha cephalotaxi]NYH84084.1 CHASE2 domain-containing sensor protein [Actinopolymorpha cephalotaxi]SFH68501.1 hypothetical protein SAMN05421678_12836 [Actinopolymorpha cephalotaxi]
MPAQRILGPLAGWPVRRWGVAFASAVLFAVVVAVPTDLIDTPLFSREVPPTWWAWPALAASSALAGLLTATYVSPISAVRSSTSHGGYAGGLLTFFAVGCPVCNKVVLLALGSAGAMTWFQPVQPLLQIAAVGLLIWALRQRVRGERQCRIAQPERTPPERTPSV